MRLVDIKDFGENLEKSGRLRLEKIPFDCYLERDAASLRALIRVLIYDLTDFEIQTYELSDTLAFLLLA